MKATALSETIAYEHQPKSDSGPEGAHQGANLMPPTRGQHRYTFGSGARPLEGYTIKRAIGRGGFGEVYYATSDAGKEVALKLITRNLEVECRGVVQCMNLKSPNLIAIHDIKTNDEGDTFVIMEYVNGPSLASILVQHPEGLPPAEIRNWLKGLVEGVAYLHDHGIVHRDLKPANLFQEEGVVKIGDYGLSKAITHSRAGETGANHSECVGTCHYMAPETSTGRYQKPIDVYAIGVILYEMVTGRVPFDGESVGEVLMKHLTSRPDLSVLGPPYRSIVERAMAKDPNHRPARVQDLLLPGDAPREPAVRFIGDGQGVQDDVVRIGMEEPIFYIGPNTRTPRLQPPPRQPRGRGGFHAWLWGNATTQPASRPRPAAPRPERRPAAPPPPPPRRPVPPPVAVRKEPPPPPAPPPAPPPLPSARLRLAELAGSMVLAAPVAAVASALVLPAFPVLDLPAPQDPTQLAYLFGLTLLGTWGALVPAKLWEGKTVSTATRRLTMTIVGLVVGILGMALGVFLGPGLVQGWGDWSGVGHYLTQTGLPPELAGPVGFAAFFGLAYAVGPWSALMARDRRSRFRFLPLLWAGLVGGLLGLALPAQQPWGALAVSLVAVVTQVVSPWNRAAAEYARFNRRKAA